MELTLGCVVIILLIAALLFISIYLVTIYNRIICYQNIVKYKFEPIEEALNNYKNIINDLIKLIKDEKLVSELNVLNNKLSNAKNTNDKVLVIKSINIELNQIFDTYKNQNINKLRKEYQKNLEKINFAKDIYNNEAGEYNNLLTLFPYNIISEFFNMEKFYIIDGE